MKLTKITPAENENSYKCNSCTVYIVLFSLLFIINVGIGAYFVYYKYVNRNKKNVSKYFSNFTYKMGEVKQIYIKNRTYYFYNDIFDLKKFDTRLLKID